MDRIPPKQIAKKIIKILKKEHPDYHYLKKVFEHIRIGLELKGKTPATGKLPELLTKQELIRFYDTVWNTADRTHIIMMKVLLYTGIRNAELTNITLKDVNLNASTIRITGKGNKDRYIPYPELFRGELAQYIENQKVRKAKYLFETNRQDKYTTRWVRAIVKKYAKKAGIEKRIYPHLFRHQLLTYLARQGIIDNKVQLISGHKNRKNLAIYQELSLADVSKEYQEAMKDFPIK